MAAPVWVLSVDLQTKTATFQSGLADAAKSARGAFNDIKRGSGEMAGAVGSSMGEARHGVMLLGEEFGIHLPRGVTTFLASLGPVGAAMEAAFPFLAIAVGATLLLEHLAKLKEEGEKLTSDQIKFATAAQSAFNSLDEKLLEAGIRTDELKNNHLGALKKQLELIDRQSMDELVKEFGIVQKAADAVFDDLKSHWFTQGIGATGAKHALETFQNQYSSLLAQGKDKEASDLLKGTRESAESVLFMMKQAAATGNFQAAGMRGDPNANAIQAKNIEAWNVLREAGVGITEKEVAAQEALVGALQTQVGIEARVAELKKANSANAVTAVSKEGGAEAANAARTAAEATLRVNEEALQADKAVANARLTMQRASIQERMASDIGFAEAELRIQLQGNAAIMAALDKGSKDYANQVKAAQAKARELIQEHTTQVAQITSRASVEQNAKNLTDLETAMREAIGATQQGTAQRLAAIDAAIRAENALNLTGTSYYRDLMEQRVETMRQATEEEAKLKAEAGAEAAAHEMKIGQLILDSEKEAQQLIDSGRRTSEAHRIDMAIGEANQELALKMTANSQQIAALDKSGKDYNNKFKALQDQQKQLTKENENEITAIKDKATMESNSRILSAQQRFTDSLSNGLTQAIMGHKSFASVMNSIGNEVVAGMLQNALKSIMIDDMTKERDAAKAARDAYKAGVSIGGPAAPVIGAAFAAAAFTAQMAFADGGIVPGVGNSDIVPAMLTPGEGVIPGGVMDGLSKMAREGSLGGSHTHYHAHVSPTYHLHAVDSDGMESLLKKHEVTLNKHVENTMRKMNR